MVDKGNRISRRTSFQVPMVFVSIMTPVKFPAAFISINGEQAALEMEFLHVNTSFCETLNRLFCLPSFLRAHPLPQKNERMSSRCEILSEAKFNLWNVILNACAEASDKYVILNIQLDYTQNLSLMDGEWKRCNGEHDCDFSTHTFTTITPVNPLFISCF